MSETQFHPVSLPGHVGQRKGLLLNRKFMSIWASKNVWKRFSELEKLIPDWPPSPKIVTNQLPLLRACVPLSCVPPMISSLAVATYFDRLWNWSVSSPLLSEVIEVGMAESQCWQSVKSAPVKPRLLH